MSIKLGAPSPGPISGSPDSGLDLLLAGAEQEEREGGRLDYPRFANVETERLPLCLSSTEKAWADASLIPNLLLGAAQNRCGVANSASETMGGTAGDTPRCSRGLVLYQRRPCRPQGGLHHALPGQGPRSTGN